MKSTGAFQIVAVLLLIASAASCEVAKEYSSRVFKPTQPLQKTDSTTTALRFMEFDSDNADDSISLKDLTSNETNEAVPAIVPKDSVKKRGCDSGAEAGSKRTAHRRNEERYRQKQEDETISS